MTDDARVHAELRSRGEEMRRVPFGYCEPLRIVAYLIAKVDSGGNTSHDIEHSVLGYDFTPHWGSLCEQLEFDASVRGSEVLPPDDSKFMAKALAVSSDRAGLSSPALI